MDRKKIEEVIETHINPKLNEHKGWVELEDITGNAVTIRFRGACSGCGSTTGTLDEIVVPHLRSHFPEIHEIRVGDNVSHELVDFARTLFTSKTLAQEDN